MRLKDDAIAALIIIIFSFFIVFPFISGMGLAGFNYFDASELRLYERDFFVHENQSVCFRYYSEKHSSVFINSVLADDMDAGYNKICLDVPYGKSNISVESGKSKIFFSAEKSAKITETMTGETAHSRIRLEIPSEADQYSLVPLNITVFNGLDKGHVFFVSIFLDGEPMKEMPLEMAGFQNKTFTEIIRMKKPGDITISLKLDTGEGDEKPIIIHGKPSFPFLFALVFLPWIAYFRNKKDRIFNTIAYSFASLVLISSFAGLFSLFYGTAFILIILTVIFFVRKRRH
ncbi:MAG: hypothetical protein QMD85_04010 [Candidatus Aenigmarchaeota archaeon]|nr:hypothetical protein [Candidatus Aenigmarchaeota archaeon]MDI6722725.1 hypothetical protein [Candidatus Aenigmarchaeota archaeon]